MLPKVVAASLTHVTGLTFVFHVEKTVLQVNLKVASPPCKQKMVVRMSFVSAFRKTETSHTI